jgi:hypothetical protein
MANRFATQDAIRTDHERKAKLAQSGANGVSSAALRRDFVMTKRKV